MYKVTVTTLYNSHIILLCSRTCHF